MTIVNSEPCAPRGARTVLEGVSTAGLPHDLDVDVSRLKLMKADHQSKQYRLQDKLLKSFPQDIEQTKKLISCFEQDIATLSAHPLPEKDFIGMEVQGHVIFDKEEAGKAILEACKQAASRGKPVDVGTYRGFDVRVVYDTFTNKFNLMMKGVLTHQAEVGTDPRGNILRMDNALATMPASLEKQKGQLANLEQQVQDAQVQVAKPFPQEEELKTKSARLAELNAVLNIEQASTSAQIGPKSEKKSVMEQLRQPSRPGTSRFHHHDREAR